MTTSILSPLDRHASNVSPPPQMAVSLPPPIPAKPCFQVDSADIKSAGKKQRHSLRRKAGRALSNERVSDCGQKAVGNLVTLHSHNGQSHFGSIETCGSVWTCPVCAAKITEGRKRELEALLSAHREAGGLVFMATLTIPHHRFQRCEDLRKTVSNGWRKVKAGKPWLRARAAHGWLGDVRALEVTHGENGWHPHLHILIFFKPHTKKETAYSFGGWLFDAWAGAIERQGFGTCSKDAFTYDSVSASEGAGAYVSKWGAALELTKANVKLGRNGGRTPWQILSDMPRSTDSEEKRLFREYAKAFKGARQLTWSRDIRKIYKQEKEQSDTDLADMPPIGETQVATISRAIFKQVVRKEKTAEFLSAQEERGVDGVLAFLTENEIRWRRSEVPGIEPGRLVPLIE